MPHPLHLASVQHFGEWTFAELALQHGFDLTPQFSSQPMLERKREPAFAAANNLIRQRALQGRNQQLLRSVSVKLFRPGECQDCLGKLMVDQRYSHFQALGHAHEIGVAQQGIEHITAHLQIGNPIDGIE